MSDAKRHPERQRPNDALRLPPDSAAVDELRPVVAAAVRTREPAPVDAEWRVLGVAAAAVYFHTERGARTRAAIHAERKPMDPAARIQWRPPDQRGDPDAWVDISARGIDVTRIPEPDAPADYAGDAAATRRAAGRDDLPG